MFTLAGSSAEVACANSLACMLWQCRESCCVYVLGYGVSRTKRKHGQLNKRWVGCTTDFISVSEGKEDRHARIV